MAFTQRSGQEKQGLAARGVIPKPPMRMTPSKIAAHGLHRLTVAGLLFMLATACQAQPAPDTHDHSDLLALFNEWRTFERSPTLDGAPDYTAETFAARYEDYGRLRTRLDAMDLSLIHI